MSKRPIAILPPQINDLTIVRCDSNGVATDGGAYFKITASIVPNRNRCEVTCSYEQRPNGPSSGTIVLISADVPTPNKLETEALGGDLDENESYRVSVTISSSTAASGTTITLPAGSVFMHKDGERNSISIGEKVTEDNAVTIAEKITAYIKGMLCLTNPKNAFKRTLANYEGIFAWDGNTGAAARVNAGNVRVGEYDKDYAALRYDAEKNRGYVFINDAPENDTDATNKAYVDAKISALRKELGLEEE